MRKPSKIYDEKAKILSLNRIQNQIFHAEILAPQIAQIAKPMQFVNIRIVNSTDPLLRRPFSLSRIDVDAKIIGITWAAIGRGTNIMAKWSAGQQISVLGPLGNGLDLDSLTLDNGLLIVAGGTGLAPLLPLISKAHSKRIDMVTLYGATSSDDMFDISNLQKKCQLHLATEDGSQGIKGFVTVLLKEYLCSLTASNNCKPMVISCGPKPMLKRVKQLCNEHEFPLMISLEEQMACGYGLCQGCAVQASDANLGYYRVCTDGPVFWANDVNLGECFE